MPAEGTMDRLFYYVIAVVFLVETASALECVSCVNTTCVPVPPSCELGRRPCSCCPECRVRLGGNCGPFTPECEAALVCLTNGGAFNARPPYWMTLVGKCVRPEAVQRTSQPPQLIPTAPH